MRIIERREGDRKRLDALVRREKNAKQRDRFRAVLLALEGREKLDIARTISRSKSFVEQWAYAYRDASDGRWHNLR